MAKYRISDHAQSVFIAINFANQQQDGSFEHTPHHLIDNIGLV
jgi:hypothetical protein